MAARKQAIIFDFDGTIADSVDEIIRIMNRLSPQYGYKRISEARKEALRHEASESILKDFKISKLKLLFLIRKVKFELNQNIGDVRPVYGMKKTLLNLKDQGYVLGIASSNAKQTVQQFLRDHDLDVFDFIYAKTVFSKSRMIRHVMKQLDVSPESVYYVGDETRDIEAAKRAGVRVIAVTWGINSREILESYNPDHLVDHPDQLASLLA